MSAGELVTLAMNWAEHAGPPVTRNHADSAPLLWEQ
jgi:hypothetical protein